ncbi:MAG: TadE family protein, partial [Candidatus Limnocylindrales bacterium]
MTQAEAPKQRRHHRRGQEGVATVEAVLVVPLVLIPVLFAVVIFGRIAHTRIVLDAAAAAGARAAAVAGADTSSVDARIVTELRDGGLDPARVQVTIEPASANWGEPIRVRLATDEDASIPFLGTWAIPLSSEFVTRSEVTH